MPANETAISAQTKEKVIRAKPGKYLTFTLSKEEYGLDIMKVQEIIGVMETIKVPKTPPFIRGMINLRDRVIPVIDIRLKFGMEFQEDTKKTCIIIVQVDHNGMPTTLGFVVDEVSEVVDLDEGQLQPPPSFGSSMDTSMITGVGRINDRIIMLLDAIRIFSSEEITIVTGMKKEHAVG